MHEGNMVPAFSVPDWLSRLDLIIWKDTAELHKSINARQQYSLGAIFEPNCHRHKPALNHSPGLRVNLLTIEMVSIHAYAHSKTSPPVLQSSFL